MQHLTTHPPLLTLGWRNEIASRGTLRSWSLYRGRRDIAGGMTRVPWAFESVTR